MWQFHIKIMIVAVILECDSHSHKGRSALEQSQRTLFNVTDSR